MIRLYTWSGRYCGFILNNYIFDRHSKYLGWLENDGRAWRSNGDLDRGKMHVNRLKNGDPSVHYLEDDEIRALRKLRRDYPGSEFVFASER